MAEDKKKVPEVPKKKTEATPKAPKEPKPAKEKAVKTGVNYILLKNFDPAGSEKMPLQCRQILDILDKAEGKTLNKGALLEEMKKVVATRQPIDRILAFYQPRVIAGKYVKMEPIVATAAPAA